MKTPQLPISYTPYLIKTAFLHISTHTLSTHQPTYQPALSTTPLSYPSRPPPPLSPRSLPPSPRFDEGVNRIFPRMKAFEVVCDAARIKFPVDHILAGKTELSAEAVTYAFGPGIHYLLYLTISPHYSTLLPSLPLLL